MVIGAKISLELNEEERNTLKKALDSYLSDLRFTIADTEHGREPLHREKEILKGILERL
ncbi:MAG: hypothetical protein AB1553_11270 [Nitrospirota bacterium]